MPCDRSSVTPGPSVDLASDDLADAGAIAQLDLVPDPGAAALSVVVELAAEVGPGSGSGN